MVSDLPPAISDLVLVLMEGVHMHAQGRGEGYEAVQVVRCLAL